MNSKLKIFTLMAPFFLLFTCHPNVGQSAQEGSKQVSSKTQKAYLAPILLGPKCLPAQVTVIGQGGPPPEGVEVVIKNNEWKNIRAIRIGWYIVEDEDRKLGGRILRVPCDGPRLPDKVILSGNTRLIEVWPLFSQQTCAIGKDPLKIRYNADRTVLTDFHLISMDEMKELTADGTFRTFKKPYALILAVSEIQYESGETWKLEGAPPPLALK